MANQLNGHDIIDKAGNCYDALYENLNKTFKEITINSLKINTPKWIGEHIYKKQINPNNRLDPLGSMQAMYEIAEQVFQAHDAGNTWTQQINTESISTNSEALGYAFGAYLVHSIKASEEYINASEQYDLQKCNTYIFTSEYKQLLSKLKYNKDQVLRDLRFYVEDLGIQELIDQPYDENATINNDEKQNYTDDNSIDQENQNSDENATINNDEIQNYTDDNSIDQGNQNSIDELSYDLKKFDSEYIKTFRSLIDKIESEDLTHDLFTTILTQLDPDQLTDLFQNSWINKLLQSIDSKKQIKSDDISYLRSFMQNMNDPLTYEQLGSIRSQSRKFYQVYSQILLILNNDVDKILNSTWYSDSIPFNLQKFELDVKNPLALHWCFIEIPDGSFFDNSYALNKLNDTLKTEDIEQILIYLNNAAKTINEDKSFFNEIMPLFMVLLLKLCVFNPDQLKNLHEFIQKIDGEDWLSNVRKALEKTLQL